MTILLSGHILDEIEHLADTVSIINEGKIMFETKIRELKNYEHTNLEAYFYTRINGGKKS